MFFSLFDSLPFSLFFFFTFSSHQTHRIPDVSMTLLQQSNDVWLWQCGMHTVCKREGWSLLWNGQKAGGLSLRVKRDERVGVWWLDGVDVSVMAWCQTLCFCQCQSHQPIPQLSATVQCVSKSLCLLPLKSVCWCCCVVPLLPFVQSIFIGNCHLFVIYTSCVCVLGLLVCVA